jgi:hypothetical protein
MGPRTPEARESRLSVPDDCQQKAWLGDARPGAGHRVSRSFVAPLRTAARHGVTCPSMSTPRAGRHEPSPFYMGESAIPHPRWVDLHRSASRSIGASRNVRVRIGIRGEEVTSATAGDESGGVAGLSKSTAGLERRPLHYECLPILHTDLALRRPLGSCIPHEMRPLFRICSARDGPMGPPRESSRGLRTDEVRSGTRPRAPQRRLARAHG